MRSREKYTKMPLCIATAQVSGPETDRIGRPYQFFTVGGPIETERTRIGWHWFGYGYGNWCSLNSTSDFLINWFFIGHGHGDWHGDWYWNGHSVNVPLASRGIRSLNTLRPRQNGRHFADTILKCIFFSENVWIPIEISLKFVPKGPINNISALV